MKDPMERSVTPEVLSEASKCKMFDLRTETLHIAAPNFDFCSFLFLHFSFLWGAIAIH